MRSLLALLALVLVPVAGAAAVQPGPNDYGPLPTSQAMTTTVSRIEPRFSAAASLVSGGKRVEARCWSTSDWKRINAEWAAAGFPDDIEGYVNYNDPAPITRVHLSPNTCTRLGKLTYRRAWRSASLTSKADLAFAVVVLAHEVQHIRGVVREPVAECYGMQRARTVARSLGLTRTQAAQLVALYWKREYPNNRLELRSRECRQGGLLDLNLSPSFP